MVLLLCLCKFIREYRHCPRQRAKYLIIYFWKVKASESESCSVVSDYSPWNSPGQSTGVGSLSLLQGIFSTQGSNSGLPHCRQILYQLSHKESPGIVGWVAYPFSSGSSRLRNWPRISCIAGRFFANWAIREAQTHRKEHGGKTLGVHYEAFHPSNSS